MSTKSTRIDLPVPHPLFLMITGVLLLVLTLPADGQSASLSTADVQIRNHLPDEVEEGYLPVDIRITPRRIPAVIQLSLRSELFSSQSLRQDRTVRLTENQTVDITMLLPVRENSSVWNTNLLVREEGMDEWGTLWNPEFTVFEERNKSILFASSHVERRKPFQNIVIREGDDVTFRTSALSAGNLWSDWRAYTWFDCLVMYWDELQNLPSPRQRAINTWVSNGGHLVVLNSPDTSIPELTSDWAIPFSTPSRSNFPSFPDSVQEWFCLRGQGFFIQEPTTEVFVDIFESGQSRPRQLEIQSNLLDQFPFIFDGDDRITEDIIESGEFSSSLQFEKYENLPILPGLGILLFFVIIIGPVNYAITYTIDRIGFMYFTIPLIAGLFTVSLLVWDVVKFGLDNQFRVDGHVVINQKNNRAAPWYFYQSFFGTGPGELQFASSAHVLCLPLQEESSSPRETRISFGEDQLSLAGFPATPRVLRSFEYKNSVEYLGGLQVEDGSDAETIRVQNGLDADFYAPVLQDEEGRCYALSKSEEPLLQEGEEKEFIRINRNESGLSNTWENHYGRNDLDIQYNYDDRYAWRNQIFIQNKKSRETRRFFGIVQRAPVEGFGVSAVVEDQSFYLIDGYHWEKRDE